MRIQGIMNNAGIAFQTLNIEINGWRKLEIYKVLGESSMSIFNITGVKKWEFE